MATSNDLLSRFASVPSLVAPEMRDRFEACLQAAAAVLAEVHRSDAPAPRMQDDFWFEEDDYRARYRPYVVKDGVLQIPVKGVLLHDFPFTFGSWATGYDYIWRAFQRGMGDMNVRAIALVCDSPGGEVAGNFDLVDRMFGLRGTKPVRAFAAEMAYSAAYSIASVADSLVVSRTGGVGSVGVVTMHVDISRALEAYGTKITFIFAGKHKVDGNPIEPLPDDVKARIQARIDELYAVFVSTVARNRGLTEEAVRATEALTFTASEALSNGFADQIGALDDSLAAFAAETVPDSGDEHMSTKPDTSAADQTAAIETARTEGRTEGERAGREAATREAAQAERARCSAILGAAETQGREEMARHLAFETDMPAEQAVALLAKAPKAAAAAPQPGNRFDEAMTTAGNPKVGPDGAPAGQATEDEEASAEAAKIVATIRPTKAA